MPTSSPTHRNMLWCVIQPAPKPLHIGQAQLDGATVGEDRCGLLGAGVVFAHARSDTGRLER